MFTCFRAEREFKRSFSLHLQPAFVGCQAPGQTGLGTSRETITTAIISFVLLQLRTESCYISTAPALLASLSFLHALSLAVVGFIPLALLTVKTNTQMLPFCGRLLCKWRPSWGLFSLLRRKIWVFALSLAFNPSCRMERLFNSSIRVKCPPLQSGGEARRRHRCGLEEAAFLDLAGHLSAWKICWRTEGGRITGTLHGKSPCAVNPTVGSDFIFVVLTHD